MPGPAALVTLIHLLQKPLPCFGGEHFWGFPRFGALFLPLPTDFACKEGDAVDGFGTVAFGLFRPFDGAAHVDEKSKLAACGRFASETFGFLLTFFFRLGGPVVPGFSKGGVLAGETDLGHTIGRKDLRDGILPLGDKEMNLTGFFIEAENESHDLFTPCEIQRDVTAIIKGCLEGMGSGLGVGAGESRALNRTRLVRRKIVFVGLGHGGRRPTAASGSVSNR